jgi:hypothetical protein
MPFSALSALSAVNRRKEMTNALQSVRTSGRSILPLQYS